ncbi:MAG: hypothetical protein K9M36_01845 [Candidatus Pacebacteria bacterium]|nr:hypothetical protein [Candidatus Paceibacterota bacterium]
MKKKVLFIVVLVIVGIFVITSDLFVSKEIAEAPVVLDEKETVVDEIFLVENYIRENITTIVPEEPVLGGTFYVVEITVNESLHNGEFIYEDGHIQGHASFTYEIQDNTVVLQNIQEIE